MIPRVQTSCTPYKTYALSSNSGFFYDNHILPLFDYFIVVGPAVTKELKKRFFSGIKKLPDDPQAKVYAPSGEYFISLNAALSHAVEKWGLQFPKDHTNYTINDLVNVDIPRHVKA